MKQIFIPAKLKSKVNKKKIAELAKNLPSQLAIAYSIQYEPIAREIKSLLPNATCLTQVLGCSKPKFPKQTKAVLLIGSGKFHAFALALETNLPIYILEKDILTKISEKDIQSFQNKKKAAYLKFLHSDKVGIFVSTKPGQQNLKQAIELKNKLKDKSPYLFIGNNFTGDFENFPVDSWVNTACPRLDMDTNAINIGDLEKL